MSMTRWSAALLLATAGCAATPCGVYSTGPAKHPLVLTLDANGRYQLSEEFTETPEEHGRWWRIVDSVVVLLPDDSSKDERYARVSDRGWIGLQLSEDLRAALPP
jgi:hypothetical protein